MKSLVESLNEALATIGNELYHQYVYLKKNSPKKIPFKKDEKVTEEMLVKYYKKHFNDYEGFVDGDSLLSYGDVNGIYLIPFEQYVMSNWNNIRLIDMKLSFNHSNHMTTLVICYGPKDKPRMKKGTVAKKESHEFDIRTSEDKVVDAKKWVHAIVTFLDNNIVDM